MKIISLTDQGSRVGVMFASGETRYEAFIEDSSCDTLGAMPVDKALALISASCEGVLSAERQKRHPLVGLEVILPTEQAVATRVAEAKVTR